MSNFSKKYIVVIILSIIIFLTLYFCRIFLLKKEYNYKSGEIRIYQYNEKIKVSDLDSIFLDSLIVNNNYLSFCDDAIIQINKNDFRKRVIGEVSVFAKYDSIENIVLFLKENGVEIQSNLILENQRIIIYRMLIILFLSFFIFLFISIFFVILKLINISFLNVVIINFIFTFTRILSMAEGLPGMHILPPKYWALMDSC